MSKSKAKRTNGSTKTKSAAAKDPNFEIALPHQSRVEGMIDEVADLQAKKKELEGEINQRKAIIKKYLLTVDMRSLQTFNGHTASLQRNTTSNTDKALAQRLLSPEDFNKIFTTTTDEKNPKLAIK